MKLIGIDPAFRADGFAVCIIDEEKDVLFRRFSSGLIDFVDWLLGEAPDDAVCVVENSNLNNGVFQYLRKGRVAEQRSKAQSVGKNQAVSQIAFDFCKRKWGKNAHEISPQSKGKKLTAAYFKLVVNAEKLNLLNYSGTQDERDALQLALIAGRKPKYKI